jgi:formate-dependent nitrite reductase membrane component NrfD
LALYLLFKGISTGAMLLSALLWLFGVRDQLTVVAGPAVGALFSALTAAVLVTDLERPERLVYILSRPNWRSWMVWGAYFLTAHGLICTVWALAGWFGLSSVHAVLLIPAVLVAIAATGYTGMLFAQGLARDLWQGPHATVDLLLQAVAEGAAVLLLLLALVPSLRSASGAVGPLVVALAAALTGHLAFLLLDHLLTPSPSRHHELAVDALVRGAFARLFWGGAIAAGAVLPLALLALSLVVDSIQGPGLAAGVAALSLAGGFAWEYVWVEAGQSVPLS